MRSKPLRTALARRMLPVVGACTMLAACATSAGPEAGTGGCSDSGLGWAVGQSLDEATYQRLQHESGAGLVNPISGTTVVRRDSRTDRLRVYVDADNRITATRCE